MSQKLQKTFVRCQTHALGAWRWLLILAVTAGTANELPPPVAEHIATDSFNRVVQTADKEVAPCPAQGKHTAVILTIGQSNAANFASRAYRSRHGSKVLNFFGGKCHRTLSLAGRRWSLGRVLDGTRQSAG